MDESRIDNIVIDWDMSDVSWDWLKYVENVLEILYYMYRIHPNRSTIPNRSMPPSFVDLKLAEIC